MSINLRLNMLNEKAASPANKPDEIVKSLGICEGNIIGDIGAGGGYFTFRFSEEVGENGKVYAADIDPRFLNFIEEKAVKQKIKNVKTVIADENRFELPEKVDMLFLRNVLHHLHEPGKYFKNIKKLLSEDGIIALIDYKEENSSFTGESGHYTPENVIRAEMEKAGFYVFKKFDFLLEQSFMLFKIIK